ncbi:hypothetical protein AU106_gp151 [Sinorhizobium phage phiM9]|uniref:Uncharacterized protein n=1 Tax=Sinorhizobium phage phiM9 TaxID=1636182 RepID=A0A0F6R522_9CAUD|nr:hypothetical protein AU106_gp151 [Sinorhizobium phage phiM9]AKE44782.1 hypothetical protein Sm_phiM9_154 [Sinorhizobium phage phiM9]
MTKRFERPANTVLSVYEFVVGAPIYLVHGSVRNCEVESGTVASLPTMYKFDEDYSRPSWLEEDEEDSMAKSFVVYIDYESRYYDGTRRTKDFLHDRNCDPNFGEDSRYNDNYYFWKIEDAEAAVEFFKKEWTERDQNC